MNRVSVAALRIVYEAVFPANDFQHPETAMSELSIQRRHDLEDLLRYAEAISNNDVGDAGYYERLASQLRQVILERDLARLTVRHNTSCKALPNDKWVQTMGRALRVQK